MRNDWYGSVKKKLKASDPSTAPASPVASPPYVAPSDGQEQRERDRADGRGRRGRAAARRPRRPGGSRRRRPPPGGGGSRPTRCRGGPMRSLPRHPVERQVQAQHVDAVLAEEAEGAADHVRRPRAARPRPGRGRATRATRATCSRAAAGERSGIDARGRRGHEVDRHVRRRHALQRGPRLRAASRTVSASSRALGPRLEPPDAPRIGLLAGRHGRVVHGRRARLEVPVAAEALRHAGGADDPAVALDAASRWRRRRTPPGRRPRRRRDRPRRRARSARAGRRSSGRGRGPCQYPSPWSRRSMSLMPTNGAIRPPRP